MQWEAYDSPGAKNVSKFPGVGVFRRHKRTLGCSTNSTEILLYKKTISEQLLPINATWTLLDKQKAYISNL